MYRGEEAPRVYYKNSPMAGWFILRKALESTGVFHFSTVESRTVSEPNPFFVPDEYFGWSVRPGAYNITFNVPSKSPSKYAWRATIFEDGSRPTSHRDLTDNTPEIYIFGDSFVFGWGVNDENTLAWHLQDFFGDSKRVRHFAHGGYSTVQNFLELSRRKDEIGAEDILISGYAPFYHQRNVASPVWLKLISQSPVGKMLENAMPRHPRARIDGNGDLTTDYVLVSCATSSEDCYYPKNKENDPVEVTRSLFDEILTLTNAKIVLLVLDGQDDDPIVTYIRDRGVDVVDVRRSRN